MARVTVRIFMSDTRYNFFGAQSLFAFVLAGVTVALPDFLLSWTEEDGCDAGYMSVTLRLL